MSYEDDVLEGKRLRTTNDDYPWCMGDLGAQVAKSYGEGTLKRFAQDVGITHATLQSYVVTAGAWPQKLGRPNFSVARTLNAQDDREQILLDNPGLTVSKARAIVRKRNGGEPTQDEQEHFEAAAGSCGVSPWSYILSGVTAALDAGVKPTPDEYKKLQDYLRKVKP